MKIIKVAVFPAGSEIGLEIGNALKYEKYVDLVGLTSIPDHSQMVFKKLHYVPFFTDETFIYNLNKVIQEREIDYIYPAHDDVLLFLTQKQNEINARIVTSPLKTIEITRSKKNTYEYLLQEDFIPQIYRNTDEIIEYPIFLKPDIGQGASGVKKINSKVELMRVENLEEMVMAEYLPGEELTVDCFTDREGKLLSYIPRKRLRIRNGIAVRSELAEITNEIEKMAVRINDCFSFKGAWFFQIKKDKNGCYKLLEIAARIPGTMGLTRNLGINYPMLTLYVHMDMPVIIQRNNYDLIVDRALISRYEINFNYDYVYIDLDDTLILKGKINTLLMLFLYQCINNNIYIYLLTRHRGELDDYLRQYKISRLIFDEIICLNDEMSKAEYIKQKSAIFIDDSFRERMDVYNKCQIPVFGIDNIESLILWK